MPMIHIVYDPNDRMQLPPKELRDATGIVSAHLPLSGKLQTVDIYKAAENLAQALLQQMLHQED